MTIMANYGHIILFSLIGGLFSLIGAVVLLSRNSLAEKLALYATPFAAGSLLAAVFLDLLPEGLHEAAAATVLQAALAGIIVFFFAERFLHWFHHHHQHDQTKDPAISLIITGDVIHNALDGIVIAAAFLVSVPAGIITTVAVAAHEIPQEIGDAGLLLARGLRRRTVLIVNIFSALATTVAALLTFTLGSKEQLPIGALIGLSAGFLLYIAMSDIIPELHEKSRSKRLFNLEPILLVAGIIVVGILIQIAGSFITE